MSETSTTEILNLNAEADFDRYINSGNSNRKKGQNEQAAADYEAAFKLDVKSVFNTYANRFAEIRFADAQFFLGNAYLNGSFGLQKNEALGIELILWGAANNQKDAASIVNKIVIKAKDAPNLQYCLGRAYLDKDPIEARKWLKKAIKNGHKDAAELYSEYGTILTILWLKENRSYIFGAIALLEFALLNLLFRGKGGTTLFAINSIAVGVFVGAFFLGPLKDFIIKRLAKLIASKPVVRAMYLCWLGLFGIAGVLYAIVMIIQRIRGVTIRNKLFLFLEDPFGYIENSIHAFAINNLQQSEGASAVVVILAAIAILTGLLLLWFAIYKIITNSAKAGAAAQAAPATKPAPVIATANTVDVPAGRAAGGGKKILLSHTISALTFIIIGACIMLPQITRSIEGVPGYDVLNVMALLGIGIGCVIGGICSNAIIGGIVGALLGGIGLGVAEIWNGQGAFDSIMAGIIGAVGVGGCGYVFGKIAAMYTGAGSTKWTAIIGKLVLLALVAEGGRHFLGDDIAIVARYLSDKKNAAEAPVVTTPVVTAAVTVNAANFREGPGTAHKVLKTLRKGDILTVIEEAAAGWLHVEHEGERGYVSKDLLSVQEGQ